MWEVFSVLEEELKISELGPLPLLKIPLFYLVPADDKQEGTTTGASGLKANLSNTGPQDSMKLEMPRSCFGGSLQSSLCFLPSKAVAAEVFLLGNTSVYHTYL